jgi:autotransporter-associated beta strand protein
VIVAGDTTLAGVNTYTGLTSVNSGATLTLTTGGSIASPNITIGGTMVIAELAFLTANSGTPTVTVAGGTLSLQTFVTQNVVLKDAGAGGTVNLAASTFLQLFSGTGFGTSSFGGIIGGAGGVSIGGDGITFLGGANTYTGGTNVNSGILIVGNSSALGTGNVDMIGTSSAPAYLASSSVYTNTALPINIGGNYTQGSNATLYLDVTSAGAVAGTDYDTLAVTGTVSLTGTLSLNFLNSVTPSAGTHYVLVTSSAGTITGTFTTTETSLGSAYKMLVSYNDTYGGTEPADSVIATLMYEFSAVNGLTPNQRAVAAYIDRYDGVSTNGDFSAIVSALGNATGSGQLGHALNELSPQRLQLFSNVAFDNYTFTTQRLDDHLTNLRDGDFGLDTSGISVTDPSLGALSQMKGRLLAWNPSPDAGLMRDIPDPILGEVLPSDPKQESTATESPASYGRNWSAFVSGNVALANVDSTGDVAKSNYTTSGATIGADYRVTANLRVGVLADYEHTDADLDTEGSKAHIDTYLPGIYLAYVNKIGFYGNALVTYGWSDYSESRDIDFGGTNRTAQGSPSGSQFGITMNAGYDIHRAASYGWTYGPEFGLSYVDLDIDSFNESGANGADLAINHESAESLRSRLGLNVRYAAKFGDIIFTPRFSIFWQHEFMDNSRSITSQFESVGTGSFSVQTTDPSRDTALLDLGLDAQINNIVTVFLDYQPALSDEYVDQSVQGGAKFAF